VTDHVEENFPEERRQVNLSPGDAPAPPAGWQARWVIHNVVRSLQTVRMTVTYPVINQAKNIWFLVTGAKKSEAFKEVQKGPNPAWTSSLVQPANGELRWYVDKAVFQQDQRRMSSSPLVRRRGIANGRNHGRHQDPGIEEWAVVGQKERRTSWIVTGRSCSPAAKWLSAAAATQ